MLRVAWMNHETRLVRDPADVRGGIAACLGDAAAQPVGSFRWQLQPFCNVLTLNVTQSGAIYTLDRFDDQCGASQKTSVVGTAFVNPDGSIGLGLSIVASPEGLARPAHARRARLS